MLRRPIPPCFCWRSLTSVRSRSQDDYDGCWANTLGSLLTYQYKIENWQVAKYMTDEEVEASAQELIDQIPNHYRNVVKYDPTIPTGEDSGHVELHTMPLRYIKNFGLSLERDYPYVGPRNMHKLVPLGPRLRMERFISLNNISEKRARRYLKKGPILAGIAVYSNFYNHKGRILGNHHQQRSKATDIEDTCWANILASLFTYQYKIDNWDVARHMTDEEVEASAQELIDQIPKRYRNIVKYSPKIPIHKDSGHLRQHTLPYST